VLLHSDRAGCLILPAPGQVDPAIGSNKGKSHEPFTGLGSLNSLRRP